MRPRFSKANVVAAIEERIANIEKKHRFDPGNGWAQVLNRPSEVAVEYGRWVALRDLRRDILEGWL